MLTLFLFTVKVDVKSSGLVVREGSHVIVLTCEVYGYPRDSSPPKWSSPGRNLETGRFNTTLSDTGPLSGGSVSSTDKVTVSQLTIVNVTEADEGEYTCSVDGESASFRIGLGKLLLLATSTFTKDVLLCRYLRNRSRQQW